MKAKFFYTGIRVKDLEASVRFYTNLLGMKVRGRNTVDAAKGTVVELVCEGGCARVCVPAWLYRVGTPAAPSGIPSKPFSTPAALVHACEGTASVSSWES